MFAPNQAAMGYAPQNMGMQPNAQPPQMPMGQPQMAPQMRPGMPMQGQPMMNAGQGMGPQDHTAALIQQLRAR